MDTKRIAVIGAGPVGLEAALYARALGHDVTLFERGRVAHHVREWGHVRFFSQFALNHSPLSAKVLTEEGRTLPGDDTYLTGDEYVTNFLEPLAGSAALQGVVREHTDVLSIGRDGLLKRDLIGGDRQAYPFRLLVRDAGVETTAAADVVLDCSGTWRQPNALGNGGIPAPGETAAGKAIRYRLDDILGADRERYEGKRVLLVGTGHSAATALDRLLQLDDTSTIWVRRDAGIRPYPIDEDDPLPDRDRLNRLGNRVAGGGEPSIDMRPASAVERIETIDDGSIRVTLTSPTGEEIVDVDIVAALVGYRPDRTLYAELQVHECWATMGPMRLAATLLGSDEADCLA
ncbi:MAG: FAD-dependent oxidoreductase, partial [Acidobacteria bacterium]|nr:FAD-dependent oxidoreductase [Acidobacteriota bacterium]NIM64084.1 FAD-dependent oxidoreductase [Acidobacteriota bacterium]NIO60980.1 FAD-dependent oxidoreductase [Acidobacteriota bacterium]NIQ31996.1 FAD-dependent oxidoreductase [Acidobacteriota bacterium]NIQ87492.1 FAD-dependent oxidoreductase [Acidobacteriota bacterium]